MGGVNEQQIVVDKQVIINLLRVSASTTAQLQRLLSQCYLTRDSKERIEVTKS